MKTAYTKQLVPALLIFLFVYTAGSKLAAFGFFRAQLSLYPFIKGVAPLLAIAVPVAELCLVVLLLWPATRKAGLYASLATLSAFTLYLGIMVMTRTDLPCSCGGVISALSWQQHILFNLGFMALSVLGIYLEGRHTGETKLLNVGQPHAGFKQTTRLY